MQRMRQPEQAPLGRVVRRRVRPRALRGGRRDVDDVPAAARLHDRHGRVAHQIRAEQVGHHHLLPSVDADVVDRRGHVDRRVVDDHVEIAERLARVVHDLQHRRFVAHVERPSDRLSAVPLEALGDGCGAIAVEIGNDHVRAVLRKFLANGLAEATATAGDECGAAGERRSG
ncbi:hypothetical protein BVI2075_940004 [Burkholderia vietnamiensis]|nr:hypothetical protein BVI2075_940004 [Burkholderia vietnamiensis]